MASLLQFLLSAALALADGCSQAAPTAPAAAPPPGGRLAPAVTPAPGGTPPVRLAALPDQAVARPRPAEAGNDGVSADAFSSLQAAIDSLGTAGGTVLLSAKTYTITKTLILPSNVAIVGQGASSVLYLASGVNANVMQNKSYNGNSNIRLANFRIDGNRAGQTAKSDGILFAYVSGSTVENVTVQNCSGHGINLSSHCTKNVVRGCNASNNGFTTAWATSGIMVTYFSTDNLIENNTCHKNNGYLPAGGTEGYDGNGIRIGNDADRNVVRNNFCDGNGRRGIKIQASYNTVTGNVCKGNIGTTIFLGGGPTTNNLVDGNTVVGCRMPGIQMSANAVDNTISNNSVTDTYHGIEAGFGAQRNKMIGNTITLSRLNGIYLHDTSDNLVQGNKITNSGKFSAAHGIRIRLESNGVTTRNQVKDNVATDTQATKTQRYGLSVETGTSYTTVTGNDFRGNVYTPGMTVGGTSNTISNNLL